MSCHPRGIEGATRFEIHCPPRSQPQLKGLALWSLGRVLARSGALTAVSAGLAPWRGRHDNTLRQRLRAVCDEARAQRGKTRHAGVVASGCAPRLAWGLRRWEGTPLAWALEATPLGTRFPGVGIRVVYRGGALPLAGTVLTAAVETAGRPEGWRRRRPGSRAGPPPWTGIVLAARGGSARGRCRRLPRRGWPPVLRIPPGGPFHPPGERRGLSLKPGGSQPGCQGAGPGVAFQGRPRRLRWPRLARWEPGYQDPWRIVTELPSAVGNLRWYRWRAWMEPGFTRPNRGGWPWPPPRMPDPARAARRGLAIAVATGGRVHVGGEAAAPLPAAPGPALATTLPPPSRSHPAAHRRWLRGFRRGGNRLRAALLNQIP
jgi:hypothetical protein